MAANSLEVLRQTSIRRAQAQRYDIISILLHWLTALLVLIQVVAGLIMTRLGSGSLQNSLFFTHKSVGVTVLLVVLFRLLWKVLHPWPALPAGVPQVQATLARFNHVLLYATLLVMAVSGFLFTASGGYPIPYLGVLELGGLIGKDPALSKWLETVHLWSQWVLYFVVVLHVMGAFYHLVVRRDGVFERMWPR